MPTLQALSSSLCQGGEAWAEERLLGALRQSVPQNSRIHLDMIECLSLRHLLPVQLAMQEKCAKFVQKHFRDLGVISPQNCVKIVRAQLLRNFCAKKMGLAHNFSTNFLSPLGLRLGVSCAQFLHNFLSQVQFSANLRLHKTEMSQVSQRTREGCGCFRGLFGVPEENSGKVSGKLLEKDSRNATNARISGIGKGKPAGNLGLTLSGPCPHLPWGA